MTQTISPRQLTLLATTLGLSPLSLAQTPPQFDAGKALQESRPLAPVVPRKAPADPVIVQPEEKPLALPAGQTLQVATFRFEGAEFIAEEELQAAVAAYKGRALSMSEIEAAADRITALYRNRGYLVARAYVPRQDASGGTLTIRVIVGKFGKTSLKNRSYVGDSRLEGYFSGFSADKAVFRGDLERAMLLVSDLPGATMPKLTIAAGETPGTSDFDITVPAGKRYGGYLKADNFGSRYTGTNRLSIGADFNSPFALGDALSFSGMASETSGLLNGRLAYSLPLGSDGLRGEIAYGKTTYQLGDIYRDLDARGYADTVEATLSYPVLRGREQNLTVALNVANREMRDELRSVSDITNKHANAATLSINHERFGQIFGLDGYASLGAGITVGYLTMGDGAHKQANQAGADTVGRYGKATLSALGRLAVTEKISASASLTLQQALFNKNLDSSEQLTISGTRGVLAFEQAVSGDNGYLFNAEVRYALPPIAGVEHSLGIFVDSGRIYLQQAGWTTTNGIHLSDAGLAYTATYSNLFARLQAANVVGDWPDELTARGRSRVLLQAGLMF